MENFIWEDKFNTGIEIIDKQHKEMFRKIDDFLLSIYSGKAKDEIRQLLIFIGDYAREHFTEEELQMIRYGYSRIQNHKEAHNIFINIYTRIKDEFEKKGSDSYFAIKVEKDVRNWWINHILLVDMLFANEVKKINEE